MEQEINCIVHIDGSASVKVGGLIDGIVCGEVNVEQEIDCVFRVKFPVIVNVALYKSGSGGTAKVTGQIVCIGVCVRRSSGQTAAVTSAVTNTAVGVTGHRASRTAIVAGSIASIAVAMAGCTLYGSTATGANNPLGAGGRKGGRKNLIRLRAGARKFEVRTVVSAVGTAVLGIGNRQGIAFCKGDRSALFRFAGNGIQSGRIFLHRHLVVILFAGNLIV